MRAFLLKCIIKIKEQAIPFAGLLLCAAVVGVFGGAVGAGLVKAVEAVTSLRLQATWLLFLLPLAGVLTIALYKWLRLGHCNTSQALESATSEKCLPLLLIPAVFLSTVMSHLCGASVGKEGAALQLGAGISTAFSRAFRLKEDTRRTLVICGMAALFSAAFGTPIGAAVFALEVACVGRISVKAFAPSILSSVIAYGMALFLGVSPERFVLSTTEAFSTLGLLRVVLLSAVCAIVGGLFCQMLHFVSKSAKTIFKNEYLRSVIGALSLIALTLLLGNTYNGGGAQVIHRLFVGESVGAEAFLLKILFTVISVAAGFKGGEIIPGFFIGATLGATLAPVVGVPIDLGAAVGMSALFCSVTKCPLATIILSMELFGNINVVYVAVAVGISFVLSGKRGLYQVQQ